MPRSHFTVQDAAGIYQFESPGDALAALLADGTPASLYDLHGALAARMDEDGFKMLVPLPVVLVKPSRSERREYAVIIGTDGCLDGPDAMPLVDILKQGWVLS
jgi:hypothetical protein